MCKEKQQKYTSCDCVRTVVEVCAMHIEHTHLQVDNDPCPGFVRTTTETALGCASRDRCMRRISTAYVFENDDAIFLKKKGGRSSRAQRESERTAELERVGREARARKLRERRERDQGYHEKTRSKKMKIKREALEDAEERPRVGRELFEDAEQMLKIKREVAEAAEESMNLDSVQRWTFGAGNDAVERLDGLAPQTFEREQQRPGRAESGQPAAPLADEDMEV